MDEAVSELADYDTGDCGLRVKATITGLRVLVVSAHLGARKII
jgi:hypothetical protein